MHRGHLAAGGAGEDEEGQRVGASRHGARHGRGGRGEGAPREERADGTQGDITPRGVIHGGHTTTGELGKPTRASHCSGSLISARVGSRSGPCHTTSRAPSPAACSTSAMNRSPVLVLGQLGLESDEPAEGPGQGRRGLAPLAQHPAEPLGRGHTARSGPVHRDVAMAFEQRHEPGHLAEGDALLLGGDDRGQAAEVEGVTALAQPRGRAAEGREQLAGIGVDHAQRLLHEPQVVLAQPRHAGELGPVGDLVQRQPQAELPGREAVATLQAEHVGADVVHEVLLRGRVVVDHQEVVLAQDAARHPGQQAAHLQGRHLAGDGHRNRAPAAGAGAEPLEGRVQEALEGVDVGPHPGGTVDDPRPRPVPPATAGRSRPPPAPRPRPCTRRSRPAGSRRGRRQRRDPAASTGSRCARRAPSRRARSPATDPGWAGTGVARPSPRTRSPGPRPGGSPRW